jgi:HSP20 family molecular chaperone IbpA
MAEKRPQTGFHPLILSKKMPAFDISASCADGILEIVIPKQAEAQTRKITVKAT